MTRRKSSFHRRVMADVYTLGAAFVLATLGATTIILAFSTFTH